MGEGKGILRIWASRTFDLKIIMTMNFTKKMIIATVALKREMACQLSMFDETLPQFLVKVIKIKIFTKKTTVRKIKKVVATL